MGSKLDAISQSTDRSNTFDVAAARRRCLGYRRRILEISQQVTALHVAPAFSCLEIVDAIYHGLMRRGADGAYIDNFLMSKGHGCLSQYVILEDHGTLVRGDIAAYCTPTGRLGAHPDYGVPGIEASTGSLGHGLALAAGMAHGDRQMRRDARVYTVLSDGELQEGSTWEAMMIAASLKLDGVTAFVDLNDFQSLGRTSETHPAFYPVVDKIRAFGWTAIEVNGHDAEAIVEATEKREPGKPTFVVCRTVKGRGVSYMENVPIWHYRSPNPTEYAKALAELKEIGA